MMENGKRGTCAEVRTAKTICPERVLQQPKRKAHCGEDRTETSEQTQQLGIGTALRLYILADRGKTSSSFWAAAAPAAGSAAFLFVRMARRALSFSLRSPMFLYSGQL
jgi:hypothetical protein